MSSINLTEADIEAIIESGDKEAIKLLETYLEQPYYRFEPRVDNRVEFDEQHSFVFDPFTGIKVCFAGNGSGKSTCAAYAVVRFILHEAPPRPLTPFLITSQSFDMVGQLYVEKIAPLLPVECIQEIRWRNVGRQFPREIILKPNKFGNSWVLDFKSYEQGRRALQAISAGGFLCDEQCPLEILEELFARCRDYSYPNSKFYICTPIEPQPDLEDLFKRSQDPEMKEQYKFFRMNTECAMKAGQVRKEWYDSYFGSLPAHIRMTRLRGDFASYEGSVFQDFNESVHVIPQRELPDGCILYRGIDFGFHHPGVLFLAQANNGIWYVFDEWQGEGSVMVEDFAQTIKEKYPDWYLKPKATIGPTYADYADPQAIAKLNQLGIACTDAKKHVLLGIECMAKNLSSGKLFIMDNCKKFIQQMKSYRWQKGPKNPLNPKDIPAAPVKKGDHLIDCARYVLFSSQGEQTKPWAGITQQSPQHSFFGTTHGGSKLRM